MKNIPTILQQLTSKKSTAVTDCVNSNTLPVVTKPGDSPYRRKFETAAAFADNLKDILALTDQYRYGSTFITYHAIRHLLQHAVTDEPVPAISYDKVMISRGHLWNTQRAIAKAAPGEVLFDWDDDIGIGGARHDDRCILVAYCEALNQFEVSVNDYERYLGEARLEAPAFSGYQVHTWLGFISADGRRIANSVYTGALSIP